MNELARALLARFADDEDVAGILYGQFMSGSFSGPRSDWIAGKLGLAENWSRDPEPRVRNWALRLLGDLRSRLREAKLLEEERGY